MLYRKHVHDDLRPYICLHSNCLAVDKMFSKRHDWMQHVLEKHWIVWVCPLCSNKTWETARDLVQHTEEQHPEMADSERLIAEIVSTRMKALQLSMNCPLCEERLDSIKAYQQHVGRHQCELSLFALPSWNDDGSAAEDNDSNVQGDSSSSSGSAGLAFDAEKSQVSTFAPKLFSNE